MKKHRAIALFSGGLDSILAVKWMQSRGYTVYPIFFRAPYLKEDRALLSATQNDIELEVIDVTEEHLVLLDNPAYGFGKRLNPCIDCHGFMFRKAAELLVEKDADFLISGEVLGQRPMSQRRDALDSVSKLSGARDLIVRPLCQLHLPDTLPIREGWVDKSDLLDFHGRGRSAQMNLAHSLGVKDYPHPAGGCLLTDRNYCLRLQDLMDRSEVNSYNLELLSNGRHFRIGEKVKLIVGRDEPDNDALEVNFTDGFKLLAKDMMGPLGLIIADELGASELQIALSIFLYYHPKAKEITTFEVSRYKNGEQIGVAVECSAAKASAETARQFRISYD
ncbi:MAG: tRNA (5-methylaminomethyl-2-thiouridylate)-methyltransferase [Candidatus Cloacimonetes bacterium HGW-Cloacimonetes-3]|jgi:tRNA U34 2-thiouridine synthase MnmA/TrmU|nr:MAG: tRNA (5-methylaminomethyl-2-thiouridylate)-methyltransferase [Candidatus Cloacimonetes bacterium HGW-Cloacimonetes-3]